MKRVLIITYYWPPSGGSGVQRWLKFSKFLPEFGWQPVVYTPENPDFEIRDESLASDIPPQCEVVQTKIWEPYQWYRLLNRKSAANANFGMVSESSRKGLMARLSLWIRGNVFVPDPRVFWVRPSFRFLRRYLNDNPVDVIVTTGPPHSMHLIGYRLKKYFPKVVWLADMRDPWSTFDVHNSFLSDRAKSKNARLERMVLETADKVILVSPSLAEEFQAFDRQKKVLIHNGFDEDDFKNLPPVPRPDGFFRIYHSGLLNYLRNPIGLWEALSELCQELPHFGHKLRIELIGTVDPKIRMQLEENPFLKNQVRIRNWMAHEELLVENQSANVFFLSVNQSRNAKAQLTGKFYEYLAYGKPIIAICPPDADIVDILKETGAGEAFDAGDTPGIKKAILNLFERFEQNPTPFRNHESIAAYSRKELTRKLAGLLDEMSNATSVNPLFQNQ